MEAATFAGHEEVCHHVVVWVAAATHRIRTLVFAIKNTLPPAKPFVVAVHAGRRRSDGGGDEGPNV